MRVEDVSISKPDKLLFPQAGISKAALADYFRRIAPRLLPHIEGRPLTLKRYNAGITRAGFFNKHAPEHFPDYVERLEVPMRSRGGKPMWMASADEAADLVYFAGQNVIELHMGLSRKRELDKPDQLIIDFDPSDGDFAKVRAGALALKTLLDQRGLPAYLKSTGSRGLHVHLPLKPERPFSEVKAAARRLAEILRDQAPELFTLEMRKARRGDRLFIDYLRNDYAMTAIAPYSPRALPGAPVATPLDWHELERARLHAQSYTLKNIFRRLARKRDPWEHFERDRVSLPGEW